MKYPIENASNAAIPPIIRVCNDVLVLFFPVTDPLSQPTINKAMPVSIIEYTDWQAYFRESNVGLATYGPLSVRTLQSQSNQPRKQNK